MRKCKEIHFFCRSIAFLLTTLFLLHTSATPAAAQIQTYRSVKTDSMKIALTFDDGPHPRLTGRILDILERYQIKATFFMVGVNVTNYPDAAKAVLAAGHEVGNHTYTHSHLQNMSEDELFRELNMCEDVLDEVCGYRPHLFRPPQGAVNVSVEQCVEEKDYTMILWSLDTRDWENKDTTRIVNRVLSHVGSGDIILMHDYIGTKSHTPQALEILIPRLLERGYEFVTVSELLEEK